MNSSQQIPKYKTSTETKKIPLQPGVPDCKGVGVGVRSTGIGPVSKVWKTLILPLNYERCGTARV